MYSVSAYGAMLADEARMEPYVEAMRRSVGPGDVVIDLGAGTGIFALLACQAGARKVYAIEPNAAIHVARQIAADNGFADRIEFIQDFSTKITLPEKAHVIFSDLRGRLPLYNGHLKTLTDAQQRLLAPGGILIPQRDTLWAAVVAAPELYEPYAGPWEQHNRGFKMQRARHVVINSWGAGKVAPDQLLVEPRVWAEIDYTAIEQTSFHSTLEWRVGQSGMAGAAHGFCLWFDALLCEGVVFSNAPGKTAQVYGSAFFPWTTPVELADGDRVKIELRADLVDDDYQWSWKTAVLAENEIKADFSQSTFFGAVHSPAQLRKQASNYVPALSEEGEIAQFILSLMNGVRSQEEIVMDLLHRYPRRFADSRQALTHIAALSNQYSR